jgi:hypothetical protein
MYSQLEYLAARQRGAELRGIAGQTRVIAGGELTTRGSGRRRRTGLTILARRLTAGPAPYRPFEACASMT